MPRYAPELCASVIDEYLHTDKSVELIARDHGINERDVTRIRHAAGVPARGARVHSLPPAMAGLVGARALLRAVPPPERGRSDCEAVRVGVNAQDDPSPPLRQSRCSASASPSTAAEGRLLPPLSGEGEERSVPVIDRIERLVEQELAAEEAGRAQFGLLPRAPGDAERCARTLAILTKTLQALARLRGGATEHGLRHDDDDMPADIDDFRNELARRIRAFVQSRAGDGVCGAVESADGAAIEP